MPHIPTLPVLPGTFLVNPIDGVVSAGALIDIALALQIPMWPIVDELALAHVAAADVLISEDELLAREEFRRPKVIGKPVHAVWPHATGRAHHHDRVYLAVAEDVFGNVDRREEPLSIARRDAEKSGNLHPEAPVIAGPSPLLIHFDNILRFNYFGVMNVINAPAESGSADRLTLQSTGKPADPMGDMRSGNVPLLLLLMFNAAQATQHSLPPMFEPNMGQAEAGIAFMARAPGYILQFDTGGMSAVSGQTAVRMELRDASPSVRLSGYRPQTGKANYLVGSRDTWIAGVPLYGGVRYEGVYPGIDLVFHSDGKEMEYDLCLSPGANPSAIRLAFRGVEDLHIESGDLILRTAHGEIRHRQPHFYQEKDGRKSEVSGRFVIRGPGEAGFQMGKYDANAPAVIDPVLSYATYLGGSAADQAYAVAVDSAGAAYVVGQTYSGNFPETFSTSQSSGNQNAFIVKLNAAGTAVVYATYFGGSSTNSARGVAVDNAGHAYVTGFTYATNFPATTGGYRSPSLGQADAFVVEFNAAGSGLVYAAMIGGPGNDFATGVAIDSGGSAYISGYTTSVAFPVTLGSVPAVLRRREFRMRLLPSSTQVDPR